MAAIKQFQEIVVKYRYVALVLIIGIVLMIIPFEAGIEQQNETTQATQVEQNIRTELQEVLSCISGVGKSCVILSIQEGEKTVYKTDGDETVLITDAQRTQIGLTEQILPPVYRGAVVVCEGGDDPQVKLAVTQAVAAVTGLSTGKIVVLKMK